MINEIPFAFELNDGVMIGIAVTGDFIQNSFVLPRASNALAHGISRLPERIDLYLAIASIK